MKNHPPCRRRLGPAGPLSVGLPAGPSVLTPRSSAPSGATRSCFRLRGQNRQRCPRLRCQPSLRLHISLESGVPPPAAPSDDGRATTAGPRWLRRRRRRICPLSDAPKPRRPPRHLAACPSPALPSWPSADSDFRLRGSARRPTDRPFHQGRRGLRLPIHSPSTGC